MNSSLATMIIALALIGLIGSVVHRRNTSKATILTALATALASVPAILEAMHR